MIEGVILLALLLVLIVVLQINIRNTSTNRNYEVGFTIMDYKMIGSASYTSSYHQNIDFDDIINIYRYHLESVLPESEAILITLGKDTSDVDMFSQKISKYWVRFSLKNLQNPENSYYLIYYTDTEARYYNVDVRNAVASAAEEVKKLEPSYQYISDDDD